MASENKRTAPGSKRVTMTLTADEFARLQFWADRREMSINEYLHECFAHMIDYENGVYDAPTIIQERMNLVIDALTMNTSKLDSLANFVTSGFESLLAAARGDDYLHSSDESNITSDEFDDAFALNEK